MKRFLPATAREALAALSAETRTAWKWDMATGLLAGLYQGCIWTFVYRVARAELQATGGQMAWIAAAPAIGFIFATVWARQMEGRAKLPFCYVTWMVARGLFIFTPLVHTRAQFVALVCVTPLLFSVSSPAYTSVMKDIYPDAQRGRLMSVVRVGMSLAALVTALVMGRLMDAGFDWHYGFALGGVFGVLSALCFSRIPVPSSPSVSDAPPPVSTLGFVRDTLLILKRNPGYRWFTASVFVAGFGNLICMTIMPIWQVDRFNVSNVQVADMQNIGAVATVLGFFFWGSFLDRRGPLATVLVAVAINLTVPVLYATAWDLGALYIAAAAMGLVMGGIELGYLNTTLLFAEPGRAAQYQALHSSFFGIRGSIAPHFAIPLMHAVGARGAFWVGLAVMLVGTALQLVSMRDHRRSARPVPVRGL